MDNQIKLWHRYVPADLCDQTLYEFECILKDPKYLDYLKFNKTQFVNGALGRDDIGIFLEDPALERIHIVEQYLEHLQICVTEYVELYPALKHHSLTNHRNIKIQKTPPYGGYHVWHCERDGGKENSTRELVWMIYLNDIPEGEGETEFLYQACRLRPTKGTVVIWPAGYSHTHRGLTVYTKAKYIATGWYHSFWT